MGCIVSKIRGGSPTNNTQGESLANNAKGESCVINAQEDTFVFSIYHSGGKTLTSQNISSYSRFQWINQTLEKSSLFDIWPLQTVGRSSTSTLLGQSYSRTGGSFRIDKDAKADRSMQETTKFAAIPDVDDSRSQVRHGGAGPLRLYDCEDKILKDRKTYLHETNNIVPPYLVLSQVWGDTKEQLQLPTVEWPVPISKKEKLDAILSYCELKKIKWLWMDILCINQTSTMDANREKAEEIPKMGEYYQGAMACLVVPEDYINFPIAYKHVTDLLSTVIIPRASVQDNAYYIWESIAFVDAIMSDQWLWRMWTYQELLLPKKHVLLDDQELKFSHLRRVLAWYYEILRNGSLKWPEGGREYHFIHPDEEMVISKNWRPDKMGWDLKEELEETGHVRLIALAAQTRDKKCKFPIDRLFGLYGLLSEEEKVPIEPNSHSSPDTLALEAIWKQTISKALASGKVWPLLHDVMDIDPNHAANGENWMPDIMAFQRRGDSIDVDSETIDHRNGEMIAVKPDGLHINVRTVGQVVGASISIGDGGGEINKMITCAWILKAKGLNTEPIVQQMMDGLARSDAVLPNDVENSQQALNRALHADSFSDCLSVFEDADLRKKLVFSASLGAWDRMILAVDINGHEKPFVFLAWVHRNIPPSLGKCWVLDVTSDPIQTVRRWVIANNVEPGIFRRIGSMASSYPIAMEDVSSPVIFN